LLKTGARKHRLGHRLRDALQHIALTLEHLGLQALDSLPMTVNTAVWGLNIHSQFL